MGQEGLAARIEFLIDVFDRGSESAAAERTKVVQSTLHRIVHGRAGRPRAEQPRINPEILMKIAHGYDVSTDWLLSGEGRGPLDRMSFEDQKKLTDPIGIEQAIKKATAEGDREALSKIERNIRIVNELVMSAGRAQWYILLRQLGLSDPAFEAWQFVPTQGVAGAFYQFVDANAFDKQRDQLMRFNGRVGISMHAASDESYKAWHVLVSHLIAAFGRDAVRERMEHSVPEAWLGFNGTAIRMARIALGGLGLKDGAPELTVDERDWLVQRLRLQPPLRGLGERDVVRESAQKVSPAKRRRGRPRRPTA